MSEETAKPPEAGRAEPKRSKRTAGAAPKAGMASKVGAAPKAQAAGTKPAPAETDEMETSGAAKEIGGPEGPEPTRFGDWERNGRCVDF